MKLMPPTSKPGTTAAKPTPKPAPKPTRKSPLFQKKAAPKDDPDMDGDAGQAEDAVSEEKEPAQVYAASARKSRPTVI